MNLFFFFDLFNYNNTVSVKEFPHCKNFDQKQEEILIFFDRSCLPFVNATVVSFS